MFINAMIFILLIISVLSGLFVLFGRDKWHRLLGYSMATAKVNMLVGLWALVTDKSFYLDIALVFIALGYIGTIVLANYMAQLPDDFAKVRKKEGLNWFRR